MSAIIRPGSIRSVRSDLELYRAWEEGDRHAGTRLIDRHLGIVTRFFANKTVHADVEELVATTFERCAQSLGRWRADASFGAYLLGIAWNILRDTLRRRRPHEPLSSLSIAAIDPSPSAVVAHRVEQRLLLAGLRAIPIEYQVALELHYFEDLSRDDAAAAVGVPPGTLASRIRRGRELLAKAVEDLAPATADAAETMHGLDAWVADIRSHLGLQGGG
jgi:RNA polymerase sigma-70 factor (ECF subfamily)